MLDPHPTDVTPTTPANAAIKPIAARLERVRRASGLRRGLIVTESLHAIPGLTPGDRRALARVLRTIHRQLVSIIELALAAPAPKPPHARGF